MLLDAAKERLIRYTQLTNETVNLINEGDEGSVSNNDDDFDKYERAVLEEEKHERRVKSARGESVKCKIITDRI